MVNRIKQYFSLNRAYEFDITDITAFIYTACAVGSICGANMTMLFLIGISSFVLYFFKLY